jgi:dynein heavy chain
MKLAPADCTWSKETAAGTDKPLGRAQHVALSIVKKEKIEKVWYFGGHHSPSARLNDTWYFVVKEMGWQRVGPDPDNTENQESSIHAPAPRANTAACLYNDKIYLFGGHGGHGYRREAFNDLYTFDLETDSWEKLEYKNNAPEGRGGHSIFASDEKIYIYGGWSSEMQFTNIYVFDLEKQEWNDSDVSNGVPRWNHGSILVEAIPTRKFFIFGGECLEYNEGTARSFGEYVNTSCYLDLGTIRWTTYASDPEVFDNIPSPREYAAMAYDERDRKILIYGGWNNGWHDDIYSLTVAKIVGPSYAITASDPCLGQLSGGVELTINGQGFKDANIRVLFTQGSRAVDTITKQTLEVPGVFVSETELTCVTPNFEQFGPKECVMQLSIANGDLTNTWIPFQYFYNTRADKSLAYGPGLLDNCGTNHPAEFKIIAKNDHCENRTSGRDTFEVKITQKVPIPAEVQADPEALAEYKQEIREIPCEIVDNDNGQYDVKYTCDLEGEISISILFLDDKGKMVPVRGSPYTIFCKDGVDPKCNLMTGKLMAE